MNSCSDLKSIGKRIRELREKSNLTQEELSKKLNIQREKLAKMETGRQDFKTQDIISIADIFNVSCDYILRGVSAENIEINKDLGLSETAISVLKGECPDYINVINVLLDDAANDFDSLSFDYRKSPSVLKTIFRYLCFKRDYDKEYSEAWYITRNGDIVNVASPDNINLNPQTLLREVSAGNIVEEILLDDVRYSLNDLKSSGELDSLEPSYMTSEFLSCELSNKEYPF